MKSRGPTTAPAIQPLLGDEDSLVDVGLGVEVGLLKMVTTEACRVVETPLVFVELTRAVGPNAKETQ